MNVSQVDSILADPYAQVWREISTVERAKSLIWTPSIANPQDWRSPSLFPWLFSQMTVLDLGCGLGRNSVALRSFFGPKARLVGLDFRNVLDLMPSEDWGLYSQLYDVTEWNKLMHSEAVHMAYCGLVFQHFSLSTLESYLGDLQKKGCLLFVATRWYLDEKRIPIAPVLSRYFSPLGTIQDFNKTEGESHWVGMLYPRTIVDVAAQLKLS